MLKIGFFSVEDSSTTTAGAAASAGVRACTKRFLRRTRTEPTCYMQMLRTLVSFPICFAAEGFCAVGKCTAVGSFVTFLMFSVKLVIISIHVYISFCV